MFDFDHRDDHHSQTISAAESGTANHYSCSADNELCRELRDFHLQHSVTIMPENIKHFRQQVGGFLHMASISPPQAEECYNQLLSFIRPMQWGTPNLNTPDPRDGWPPLHWMLDVLPDERVIDYLLELEVDPNIPGGPIGETALHVAARRRRLNFVEKLLDHGADINAKTRGGKTAWVHSARRGFGEIANLLADRGAEHEYTDADAIAIYLSQGDMKRAEAIAKTNRNIVPNMKTEEARILPDLAGRPEIKPIRFLLDSGADITARGLDGGTALHQACWFGQPANARLLIKHHAPLEDSNDVHDYTPLGWVCHGSRQSGNASERSDAYVQLAEILLEAGASLAHPNRDDHGGWLLADASEPVMKVLKKYGARE